MGGGLEGETGTKVVSELTLIVKSYCVIELATESNDVANSLNVRESYVFVMMPYGRN